MGAGFDMRLTGAEELERKMRELPKAAAKKVSRRALRVGAKVIQVAAKDNARAIVGGKMGRLLRQGIAVRAAKRTRRAEVSVNVMMNPKHNDRFIHMTKSGKRYYIPAAIEYGHGADKAKAARPFMRPAWDNKKRQALDKVLKTMQKEIDLAARKV